MSQHYCLIHYHKIKSASHATNDMSHNRRDRIIAKRDNIDPSRSHLNSCLFSLPQGISTKGNKLVVDKIKALGVEKTIRKDAVRCVDIVMSASHDAFEDGTISDVDAWAQSCMDFIKQKHGDRLIEAHLHMDEKTPHIHATIVPVTEDLRLNAKAFVFGSQVNKKGVREYQLEQVQTDFADYMQSAGYALKRGERGTGIKRISESEYLRQRNIGANRDGIDRPKLSQITRATTSFGVIPKLQKIKVASPKQVHSLTAQVNSLAGELAIKDAKIKQLKKANSLLSSELTLLRPIASSVRGLDIKKVLADWQSGTGKKGQLGKAKNAIDLIMSLDDCTYKEAVITLANNYSTDDAVATAVEQKISDMQADLPTLISSSPSKPTWQDQAKKREEKKQIESLTGWKKMLLMLNMMNIRQAMSYDPPSTINDLILQQAPPLDFYAFCTKEIEKIADELGLDVADLSQDEIHDLSKEILKKEGVPDEKTDEFLGKKREPDQDEKERKYVEESAAKQVKDHAEYVAGRVDDPAVASQIFAQISTAVKAVETGSDTSTLNVPSPSAPKPSQ